MSQGTIERLQPPADSASRSAARQRLFVLVSGATLLLGLLFTALQPAEYRSFATVLSSSPPAIDESMRETDLQGVAIQRHRLLGREIVERLADQLRQSAGIALAPQALAAMLRVETSADTSLLDLSASGPEGDWLPTLVENWIDVYGTVRADDISASKSQTLARVEEELAGLQEKVDEARLALDEFRTENEIISMDRQQNAVMSQLDGLNRSLNTAVEEQVRAQARLETIRRALADGVPVVPRSDRSEVTAMAEQLAAQRARLAELSARYTEDYIAKDPRLRHIPERISELEAALEQAYRVGSQAELINAERELSTANETVADLESRLDAQRSEATAFTSIYATHQALVKDLGELETLYRDTQSRLVQVDVRRVDKYPQLTVVSPPTPYANRIGPDYLVLIGGSLLASVLLGVFAVWLQNYLNPPPPQPAVVAVSGVPLYQPAEPAALAQGEVPGALRDGTRAPRLDDRSDEAPAPADSNTDDPGASSGRDDGIDDEQR